MNLAKNLILLVVGVALLSTTPVVAAQIGGCLVTGPDPDSREVRPVISTCPDPVQGPGGMAFDGAFLWVGDYSGWPRISKVDPATCAVVSQLEIPNGNVGGVAWDGEAVWVCYEQAAVIQRIDPNNGAVLTSFNSPGHGPEDPDASGLAWDGTYLWHADYGLDMIYRLDPQDGTVLQSFASPGPCPGDIEFDAASGLLVVADCIRREFILVDPATGAEVSACGFPILGHWGVAIGNGLVCVGQRVRFHDQVDRRAAGRRGDGRRQLEHLQGALRVTGRHGCAEVAAWWERRLRAAKPRREITIVEKRRVRALLDPASRPVRPARLGSRG